MTALIGIYGRPEAVRIELDDEARRTISKEIGKGAVVVGVAGHNDAGLQRLIAEATELSWLQSGRADGDE